MSQTQGILLKTLAKITTYFCAQATKLTRQQIFATPILRRNNVSFGNYGAIPNGNGYRVNYETVSIPDGTDNRQAFVLVLRRIKIVGDKNETLVLKKVI